MSRRPPWYAAGNALLVALLSVAITTCVFPTGERGDEQVIVYQLETIQRLEPLETYLASRGPVGSQGLRPPEACDSTTGRPGLTCRWLLYRGGNDTSMVDPKVPFRLGDRIVVRARVGERGTEGTEVLLRPVGEGQRGPAPLRFTADTIDLLSVGESRIAVHAAGFPGAAADTLTLFTYPARLSPKCGTPSTNACTLDSLLVGEALEIRGGPFAAVREPATGAILSVLPEPSVMIGGLPAPVLERSDTLLRVGVPAGASPSGRGLVGVTILGLPAVCTPSLLDDCYQATDYAFRDWDVLEPVSASSPTDLGPAVDDSTLAWQPALTLEGTATPWALDAAGRAHDWYTFGLDEPTVVQVEITSVVPIDLQLSDTLAWDAGRARARVVPGGWAVGSRPACQGVELALAFPEADRGGVKRMTVALAAGRHHLVVSSTGPLPSLVGYGLRLIAGGVAPGDDSRCESAVPFTEGATGRLDGAFDVDWFTTTPTDSAYTAFLASSYTGEVPGVAVLRDQLPDSLPVIAQGNGRAELLLTPGRHLIALLGNGRPIFYTLKSQPATWAPPRGNR